MTQWLDPPERIQEALAELRAIAHDKDANPATLGGKVDKLAFALWERDCRTKVNWPAAYNIWLLLWEHYRLKDLWCKLPGYRRHGARETGNLPLVLQLVMYGFWCRTWGYDELDARVGGICARHLELPLEPLNSIVKPVIDLYLAARLPPDAGITLAQARAKARKAPFERGSMHTEFWPYDTLAPELAYCQRLDLPFPPVRGIYDFPHPASLAVFPEVEEALVAVACSRWGSQH